MKSHFLHKFVVLTLLMLFSVTAQTRPFATFYSLPTTDSIKFTNSFCVFQDSKGIIWIGTTNGLARYNSSKVTIYRNNPDKKHSLPSNVVREIVEGPGNILWLATINGGLVSFNPETEVFNQYSKNIDSQLWSITLDWDGTTIWLGALRNGLSRFDIKTKKVTNFDLYYIDGTQLTKVNAIYQQQKYYLLGTGRGLYKFIPGQNVLVEYQAKELTGSVFDIKSTDKGILAATSNGVFHFENFGGKTTIYSGQALTIETDSQGLLYAGLWKKGLSVAAIGSTNKKLYKHLIFQETSLPHNNIWDIEVTNDKMVFVATKAGTAVFNPNSLMYTYYDRIWLDPQSNKPLFANSVFSDSKGSLWIGANNKVIKHNNRTGNIQRWSNGTIIAYNFIEDNNGTIWIADQNGNGLMRVRDSHDTLSLKIAPTKKNACCDNVNVLLANKSNTIWVGTNGSGIARYNPAKNIFSDFYLKNTFVSTIEVFDDDTLLVGSFGGLYSFNVEANLTSLVPKTKDYFIFDIYKTKNGSIYIGTNKGLLRVVYRIDGVLQVEKIDLIKSKSLVIFSILEADNGDLWLGTGAALARYRPSTGKTYLLRQEQGVPMLGFYRNSAAKSKVSSTLYFGGQTGVIAFNPKEIKINNSFPEVFVSSLNVSYPNNEKTYNAVNNIRVNPGIKAIEFQFYSLDYRSPATPPNYSYMLVGFSEKQAITHADQVTFTNLDPGTYTFKIKAANSFGEWGDEFTQLTFTVLTPWWMTWWAYTLYAILAVAILGLLFWYQNRRLTKERDITAQLREAENLREHFVQELEGQVSSATHELRDSMEALQIKTVELEVANKRSQDSTQLKSQFLANISHELRTPMNGILGFINLLNRTALEDKQREYVGTIRQSGESLMDIINNVLDISKIEAGKITLDITGFNLRDCIESTLALLVPIAYEKKLELCCIIEPSLPLQLRGDPARLRQILTNLLGNAIKFTQSGTVNVRVLTTSHAPTNENDDIVHLTIAISDTGIGIAPDHMERLFTSFNQATPGIERRFGGTGLGLSLSKMLVEAMDGKIDLQSTPNVGTTARIELSLSQDSSAPEWQVDPKLARHTVLLYDEHPLCAQGLVFLLQSWGMQVIETSNYEEWQAEMARHARQPRYAAFIVALSTPQIRKAKTVIKKLRGKQSNLPLLVLASTLDLTVLYNLETALGLPCLAKHVGSRMIHNTLLALLDDQPQFSHTARKLATNQPLAGLRILIADDNAANRELLRHMLRQSGAHTAEAADGREALERLNAVDDKEDKRWDLLLLDIHMPNVSGMEVIARIRDGKTGNATLPVIAVTANAMPEMQQWAIACGMDGYIIKPFTEEKLLEEIQRVLPKKE